MARQTDLWGACPRCGGNDGALRVPLEWSESDEWPEGTRSDWNFCLEHRLKWRLFGVISFESDSARLTREIDQHNDAAEAERIGLEDFRDVTDELPDESQV